MIINQSFYSSCYWTVMSHSCFIFQLVIASCDFNKPISFWLTEPFDFTKPIICLLFCFQEPPRHLKPQWQETTKTNHIRVQTPNFTNIDSNNATNLDTITGPRQANLVLIAYGSSEGSDEPAHPRSLARTFAARWYKQWVKRNLQTESQIPGPSEWLGMRS